VGRMSYRTFGCLVVLVVIALSTTPVRIAGAVDTDAPARGGTTERQSGQAATTIHYFALGDSVASGHGLNDDTKDGGSPTGCRLSTLSYPYKVRDELLKRYAQVDFNHLACSGATALARIGADPNEDPHKWFRTQVEDVLRILDAPTYPRTEPTLVSISISMNDLPWTDLGELFVRLNQPKDTFMNWANQRTTTVARLVKYDVDRLLRRPNVTVVLTEYHNPINPGSHLFSFKLDDQPLLKCPDMPCAQRADYAVTQLNAALTREVVQRVNRPGRLAITTGLYQAFRGHESPIGECGTANPPLAQTWVQYPSDPASNSLPTIPRALRELSGVDVWRGDCFHPNEKGAAVYAYAVNTVARRLGR
jgi:lysophospholipase L1-like esterase